MNRSVTEKAELVIKNLPTKKSKSPDGLTTKLHQTFKKKKKKEHHFFIKSSNKNGGNTSQLIQ